MIRDLDRSRPICPQICEQISVAIASGELKPGEKIMSVREVAQAAKVNPNTVQKSFEELERTGTIYSVRGSGWFVAQDVSSAREQMKSTIKAKVDGFFAEMERLGVSPEEAKKYVEEWKNE